MRHTESQGVKVSTRPPRCCRMPGHMNVLLVKPSPYARSSESTHQRDFAKRRSFVIGANDVTTRRKNDPTSPLCMADPRRRRARRSCLSTLPSLRLRRSRQRTLLRTHTDAIRDAKKSAKICQGNGIRGVLTQCKHQAVLGFAILGIKDDCSFKRIKSLSSQQRDRKVLNPCHSRNPHFKTQASAVAVTRDLHLTRSSSKLITLP